MHTAVVWFEIPVKDLKRAMKFYSEVLGTELKEWDQGPKKMAFFSSSAGCSSEKSDECSKSEGCCCGALVEGEPSEHGTLIYFNGGDDLSVPLQRVEKAGGIVLMDKMSIGEHGFIAFFRDTEGNKIAFHSMH